MKVARQHEKIELELEDAADALEAVETQAAKQVAAARARFRFLQKQKRLWSERVTRMVRRGVATLEELDELERSEVTGPQISTDDPVPGPIPPLSDEDLALILADPVFAGGGNFEFPNSFSEIS